jgi:dihydroneopterin aldolase
MSLRQFDLPVRIGVHDFERSAAQRMWFDVDICVRLEHAPATSDDISSTLNYDFLREMIQQTVGDAHHELQETLCDALFNQLMSHPQIMAARVNTSKPDVYPDCLSIGTERVGCKTW